MIVASVTMVNIPFMFVVASPGLTLARHAGALIITLPPWPVLRLRFHSGYRAPRKLRACLFRNRINSQSEPMSSSRLPVAISRVPALMRDSMSCTLSLVFFAKLRSLFIRLLPQDDAHRFKMLCAHPVPLAAHACLEIENGALVPGFLDPRRRAGLIVGGQLPSSPIRSCLASSAPPSLCRVSVYSCGFPFVRVAN